MDRDELKRLLQPFRDECEKQGRPLKEIQLKEAFPGDISTSYILQISADWIEEIPAWDAIDFLFDILWKTADEEVRKHVFSIQVLNSGQQISQPKQAEIS